MSIKNATCRDFRFLWDTRRAVKSFPLHLSYVCINDESVTPTWYSKTDAVFLESSTAVLGVMRVELDLFPLLIVGSRDAESVPHPLPYKPLHPHPL